MHSLDHLGPKKWFGWGDGSEFFITETIGLTWLLMIALTIFAVIVRKNLKERPGALQALLEWYVELIYGLVESAMGKHNMKFAAYFASIFLFMTCSNALGLLGLRPITADLNSTAAMAAMSFFCVHFFSIKSKGIIGYLKHMGDPYPFLLPINMVAELAFPLSLCLRLFGNITGGAIIVALCIGALESITQGLNISVPFFSIGLPIIANSFFDVFEPVLQAFIFFTLSTTFVGINNQLPGEHH